MLKARVRCKICKYCIELVGARIRHKVGPWGDGEALANAKLCSPWAESRLMCRLPERGDLANNLQTDIFFSCKVSIW